VVKLQHKLIIHMCLINIAGAYRRLSRVPVTSHPFANKRMASFKRLVRFIPKSDTRSILIGEPLDPERDIGLATRKGEEVKITVFSGYSALDAGSPTNRIEVVDRILSPISQSEIGTIRGIGLNVSWLIYESRTISECNVVFETCRRDKNAFANCSNLIHVSKKLIRMSLPVEQSVQETGDSSQ
jgi:hypothetical protein